MKMMLGLRLVLAGLMTALVTMAAAVPPAQASADGSFTLISVGSRKCIEVAPDSSGNYFAAGNKIQQRTCDGSPAQVWVMAVVRFDEVLGYHIINRLTNQCLDVPGGGTANMVYVQQRPCDPDAESMAWYPGEGTTEWMSFQNLNSDKCLDVANGSVADRALLWQYTCTHLNPAQEFSRNYNWDSVAPPTPFPTADLITKVAAPYSGQFTAGGGTAPYTWSVTGLPPGVGYVASTGTYSGTPTALGVFNVVYRVTDAAGNSDAKSFVWTVIERDSRLFSGTATASKATTALATATSRAVSAASSAGFGSCEQAGDSSVEMNEFGTWDASTTMRCFK